MVTLATKFAAHFFKPGDAGDVGDNGQGAARLVDRRGVQVKDLFGRRLQVTVSRMVFFSAMARLRRSKRRR
jgi:hypothetical protein